MSPADETESVYIPQRTASPADERNETREEIVDESIEEEAVDVDTREHLSLVCSSTIGSL